jgi:hypothetical protein
MCVKKKNVQTKNRQNFKKTKSFYILEESFMIFYLPLEDLAINVLDSSLYKYSMQQGFYYLKQEKQLCHFLIRDLTSFLPQTTWK